MKPGKALEVLHTRNTSYYKHIASASCKKQFNCFWNSNIFFLKALSTIKKYFQTTFIYPENASITRIASILIYQRSQNSKVLKFVKVHL